MSSALLDRLPAGLFVATIFVSVVAEVFLWGPHGVLSAGGLRRFLHLRELRGVLSAGGLGG